MSLFESFYVICDEIKQGKVENETLSAHLSLLESDCSQTERQIEEGAAPGFEEELAKLKTAFSQFKEGISQIKGYLLSRHEAELEKGVTLLETSFEEITVEINKFFLERMAASPSQDGPLNILIHTAPHLEQEIGEDFFGKTLTLFERHFKGIRRNLRHIIQTCEMNSELQEALENQLPDLQSARQTFKQIQNDFNGKNYRAVQENLKILASFIQEYNEFCKKVLDLIAKNEGKNCPRCGTRNPGGAKTCVYCSFVFPFQDQPLYSSGLDVKEGETASGEPILSRNLAKIYKDLGRIHNLAEDYQDEEVSKQELLHAIEQAKEKAVSILNRLSSDKEKLISASPKNEENLKLAEAEEEGFQLILEGLATTQTWVESQKTEDYWNGFKQAFTGMTKLQETKASHHS